LRVARAVFVVWNLERGEMTVHRWSPLNGYRRVTRSYP
jgi:hypothetical protein